MHLRESIQQIFHACDHVIMSFQPDAEANNAKLPIARSTAR
jgi:hypothetical protein